MALIKSEKAKNPEKRKIEEIFRFKYGPEIKIATEKNKLKKRGIAMSAIGIKIANWLSNVNELTIQCIPLK